MCGGVNQKDSQGNCAYLIHPGDTDMDGNVNVGDINPIVEYWGTTLFSREKNDIKWEPKDLPTSYSYNDECLAYADANGDGKINIADVAAVYVNLSKSHSHKSTKNCASLARNENIGIYYSIFASLPPGELKNTLAETFNFSTLPDDFTVSSAYPNPFNPITNIKFQVSSMGDVHLYVFNLQGQIIDEKKYIQIAQGNYNFIWDGTSSPSGIYIIHVYYNEELQDKQKIILIK